MGTPEIARVILQKLHEQAYDIVAVFAQPDRPSGRGHKLQSPPVAEYATQHGLTLYQPDKLKDPAIVSVFDELKPDYIVVAAYGRILPEYILNAASKECLNVHASLLPKYRGAAPINYSLLEGESETGVSIMRVVKELDAGPVFLMRSLEITDADDAVSLTERLSHLGAEALLAAIEQIEINNLKPIEQDHTKSTYAHKLSRETAVLKFDRSAQSIVNQVRALVPWPVAQTTLADQPLKVYVAKALAGRAMNVAPGTIVHIGREGWTVATADCDVLLCDLQLHGKKRMSAYDLANGLRLKPGTRLTEEMK